MSDNPGFVGLTLAVPADAISPDAPADRRTREFTSRVTPARYFGWKGFLSRTAAAGLLIPGLPVIGATMLLVRLTSKGPAIFRQIRVGRYGETFTMYKIRTMRVDAEAQTGPVWATRHDSRITPLGRWIRSCHLDEFPQLINVLRGEMALIGPRPERPEFTQRLARDIPGYMDRLAVLPGITGLAQINLPPDTDLDSVRLKLILDREYVEQGSLWLDCRIMLCTFLRLIGIKGLKPSRLCGILRQPKLEPVEDQDGNEIDAPPQADVKIPVMALQNAPQNGAASRLGIRRPR